MSQQANLSNLEDSPFYLENQRAFEIWRQAKKAYDEPVLADLLVNVADPYKLSPDESLAIRQNCNHYNMAVYQIDDASLADKSLVHALGEQLSLVSLDANLRADEDSVSSLEVRSQSGNQYIPYTNKALSWHTDGYYNTLNKQIYGIVMHCVRPAAEGGINSLLNHEKVYMALRNENPAYIEALMHPQAMTIPDNVESGKVIRAEQSGPVFMVKAPVGSEAGRLHMRFSARKRNIIWRDTPETLEAVDMINRLMADDGFVFKVGLKAGQGIVCNNVLHNRSGFTDSETQQRLLYRARFYDAVG